MLKKGPVTRDTIYERPFREVGEITVLFEQLLWRSLVERQSTFLRSPGTRGARKGPTETGSHRNIDIRSSQGIMLSWLTVRMTAEDQNGRTESSLL